MGFTLGEITLMQTLLAQLKSSPETLEFSQVMEVISANYDYTPSEFTNGDLTSAAGSNEGSCKIFAFAQLQELNEADTLALFGAYYRKDVLENPEGEDHGNIRNFMKSGWSGVSFANTVLTPKS